MEGFSEYCPGKSMEKIINDEKEPRSVSKTLMRNGDTSVTRMDGKVKWVVDALVCFSDSPRDLTKSYDEEYKTKSTTYGVQEKACKLGKKLNRPINGGRWTQKEHDNFLIGLQLYGREWKRVAKYVYTRTSCQIRSHAQKYFAKLEQAQALGNQTSNKSEESFAYQQLVWNPSLKHKKLMALNTASEPKRLLRSDLQPSSQDLYSAKYGVNKFAGLSPRIQRRMNDLRDDELCAVQVLVSTVEHKEESNKRPYIEKQIHVENSPSATKRVKTVDLK